MKLAPTEIPKSAVIRVILEEPQGEISRTFLAARSQLITVILLVLVGSAFLWYRILAPAITVVARPVVRVPHAQQVLPMEADSILRVGDTIFFPGSVAPNTAMIAAVPLQGIKVRDGSGVERLLILGGEHYYVIAADGVGHLLDRTDIRGIVRTQP